tara:strand:- start:1091 stop:1372 length:282 start_codon:yes stop_codon:yes gene_type:complete
MNKLRKETGLPLDFTFHDIKAKSISDYEGDKQRFSGHKTRAQMESYNRKGDVVPSLGAEKKDYCRVFYSKPVFQYKQFGLLPKLSRITSYWIF